MKSERSQLDDNSTPASDGDACLVDGPVTELHKNPPALILVKKPAGGIAGHGSKLKRQKEAAILALLTNRSIEEAARAARIGSATTLVRWLKQEDFNNEYPEARRTAFLQSITRLQQVSSAAASVMMKMLADPNAPAAVRVRAADSVLKHARYGMEIEDIDARLAPGTVFAGYLH